MAEAKEIMLVADAGGTNTTFAFVGYEKGKFMILHLLHFPSQGIKDFTSTVAEVLAFGKSKKYYVDKACFAGAGRVSEKNDECIITKLPFNLEAVQIKKRTGLQHILIINDFIAVAYGINCLPSDKIIQLKTGTKISTKPIAILGAGTGLGKAVLVWNHFTKRYMPVASEGGHSNAALQTQEEFEFGEFIKKKYARERVVWEDVLSGNGISNVYQFFQTKLSASMEIQKRKYDPLLISQSTDPASKATINFFARLYARCAQNLALDVMALGGVYIAGGIVTKNLSLFKRKVFIEEFRLNHRMKLLEEVPIFAVTDYHVGLYGAAQALMLYQKGDFP